MSDLVEEWRDIPGWENFYRVSDAGRVYSVPREIPNPPYTMWIGGKFLKPSKSAKLDVPGTVHLRNGEMGLTKTSTVASLVLRAFVREPFVGEIARHVDGNPKNDRLSNLVWQNKGDMFNESKGDQTGEYHPGTSLLAEDVIAIRVYAGPLKPLAGYFGVTVGCVSAIRRKKNWACLA